MRRLFPAVAVLALAAAACGDSDVPAGPSVPVFPDAELNFRVDHPELFVREYQLVCDGAGEAVIQGSFGNLRPPEACESLNDPATVSRLVDGPPADQVCTEIYGGDDTAVITGTVGGRPVDTTVDRANGCGIADWDETLGQLLPLPFVPDDEP